MERSTARLLALLVGIAVGGGTYVWLVADAFLAAGVGLFWALAVGLSIRHREWVGSSTDWKTVRWTGAQGGLASLAVMVVAASPVLPLSTEYRFALGLLVLGASLTMLHLGVGLVLEARDGPGNGDVSDETDGDPGRDAVEAA